MRPNREAEAPSFIRFGWPLRARGATLLLLRIHLGEGGAMLKDERGAARLIN
jgi:hypothetical protein